MEVGEVNSNGEFGMIIKSVHWLLCVAVPDDRSHIIRSRSEYISMEWTEFDSAHGQLMACQHHDGHVCSGAQVPYFDQVIGRGCSQKVLILVKVNGQDLIGMCMNSLDILARAQVPDARCLVARATAKDRLVSGVPDCRVYCVFMLKALLGSSLKLCRVPQFNRLIE